MAKRGLLDTRANVYETLAVTFPRVAMDAAVLDASLLIQGAHSIITKTTSLGNWITDTVANTAAQYPVDATYCTWVDVVNAAEAYTYYRATGTTSEVVYGQADYYSHDSSVYGGPVGTVVSVQPATQPQPANTVASRPALSQSEWDNGKRWYYFGGVLVASYFDPNTFGTVSAAKAELITRTKAQARTAMANQAREYTLVTLHTTSDFTTLDTADYATYNLSNYNTFLNTQVTNATTTINGETTLAGLYAINPEGLDTDPT